MARLPTLRRRRKTRLERLTDALAKTEAVSRSVSAAARAARTAVSSAGSGRNRPPKTLAALLVPVAIGAGAFILIRRKRSTAADTDHASSAPAAAAPGESTPAASGTVAGTPDETPG